VSGPYALGSLLISRQRHASAPLALGDEARNRRGLIGAAAHIAEYLRSTGARTVLLACSDPFHVAAGMLAIWSCEGGVAALPSNLRRETVEAQAQAAGADLVLGPGDEWGVDLQSLLGRHRRRSGGHPWAPPTLPWDRHVATVFTSGTTGASVACPKDARQLLGEALFLGQHFHLGPAARVLATPPPYHLFGLLFGVLAPLFGGGAFVRAATAAPAGIAAAARRHDANVLCCVPAHLAGFATLDGGDLPTVERLYVSGGRLDPELLQMLTQRFSFSIIEVFGSSETGGIAFRDSRATSSWTPFDGVKVDVDLDGRLLVDSPFVPSGKGRPHSSADRIEMNPDGTFRHLGRIDDVVKIGGERVSVAAIEDCVHTIAGVREVAILRVFVGGVRQWELWAAIAAEGVDEASVRLRLSLAFESVAIPRRFKFVAALPREDSGKVTEARLRGLFDDLDSRGNQPRHELGQRFQL
jgi:acyl-coenzyme A synthetase/AMP-(fatty) acid ligase